MAAAALASLGIALLACGPNGRGNAVVPYPVRVVIEGIACDQAAAQAKARGLDDATTAALVAACNAAAVAYGAHAPRPASSAR